MLHVRAYLQITIYRQKKRREKMICTRWQQNGKYFNGKRKLIYIQNDTKNVMQNEQMIKEYVNRFKNWIIRQ